VVLLTAKTWFPEALPGPIDNMRDALVEVAVFLSRPHYRNEWCRQQYTDAQREEARQKAIERGDSTLWFDCIITLEDEMRIAERAAACRVDDYLSLPVRAWHPGQWKPDRPRFVDCPVRWRAKGYCEGCLKPGLVRDFHHLHYNSFGRETPNDLALLCRACHDICHRGNGVFYSDPTDHPVYHPHLAMIQRNWIRLRELPHAINL
jgi:hypothetical protein